MEGDAWLLIGVSLLLILANAFFVAAEYSIVSSRRSSIEALSRKRKRGNASLLLRALDDISPFVAASQIAITMVGIGVGAVTEPFVTRWLTSAMGRSVDARIGYAISFVLVSFVLVVIGELFPKYLVLNDSERIALRTVRPLMLFVALFKPLIWLSQAAVGLMLRPFHIDLREVSKDIVQKDELLMLVRAGGAEGVLDVRHAEVVTRVLRIDQLDARDIMVHRLDMKWLDVSLSRDQLLAKLKKLPYTRLPVCRGDIDEMVGIAYLHDVVRHMDDEDFSLEKILRPAVMIPENLQLGRIVGQMRDNKIQMLIVVDEYGGTSGLITLEDVIEEVFGELEDRLESERPRIEVFPGGRISARADVRMDELLSYFGHEVGVEPQTDTLATMIVNGLGHVPRPGDSIDTSFGKLRVENMARRRITRVSIHLVAEAAESATEE